MALQDFAAEMDRCSQCSYCKWIPFDQMKSWRFSQNCPSVSYYHFNSHSARGRYVVARSLLRGESGYTDMVRDIVFTCLACGACDVSCKVCRYNLEPLEMVRALKCHLVEDGQGLDTHRAVVHSMTQERNRTQAAASARGVWADDLDVPRLPDEKATVLFHAGCRFSYDGALQPSARAAVRLLQSAGVDVGILGERETCCGGRVYSMGYQEPFAAAAAANAAAWAAAGVETIVTSCADCYHAFKRLYPQLGVQVRVLHTVELLAELIRDGRLVLRTEVPMTVTYHDPCHLGRQGETYVPWDGVEKKILNQVVVYEPKKPRYNGAWGVYDAPREVLRAIPGLELVEMERIREYSWCCGAGGGACEAYPEFASWTAGERLAEAASTGAEALVSACPGCERSFLDAAGTAGSGRQGFQGLRVYDIVDLVQQAVGQEESS
ncbi:MAG TPA: (Fe-S)-binding protein [Anaerolineae bacterium]|nr:(Fe-S)-binding protein [Anaerolineae bacterium]